MTAARERLPSRRSSATYTIHLDGRSIHVTLGLYPDGRVGEVFVATSKTGSALRTALDTWAMALSKALQFGVPLRELTRTFVGTRCDEGIASCEGLALDGQRVSSTWDAVARLLELVTDEEGRMRDE